MNNTTYIRYAESARVNWITHFAGTDPAHRSEWLDLMKPKGTGLIMKAIKAEYKFVRCFAVPQLPFLSPSPPSFSYISPLFRYFFDPCLLPRSSL